MLRFSRKDIFGMVALGSVATAMAYNPISTYHYLGDPAAAADDEYFYIIAVSDDPSPYNSDGYKMYALYGFRSKDMQNWTDIGIIYDARKVDDVNNIWASGIAANPNDGRLYIVLADGGGGGIGLIRSDSIDGVWTNPVTDGKKLISNFGDGLIDCDDVSWCFDPAIFFDDDGTGYVTWGGGENDRRSNADNFDVIKLNSSYDGFTGNAQHVKVSDLPVRKMLEASYIHKHDDKYYFSYSTGWQQGAPTIDYAMGSNPMGPFTWKGTILGNPSIDDKGINGANIHHGIAEFKGHSYVVYHDRRIASGYDGLEIIPADDGQPKPNEGYHRSISVDEMFYNADGTIKQMVCTKDGPEQIEIFDPYDWYPALTSSKQKGVRSRTNWAPGKIGEHLLLPLSSDESWIRVSGVDFGKGASNFVVEAASVANNDKIEIRKGSATGTLAGTCTLTETNSKTIYAETKCDVEGLSGIVDQLFLVFKGSQDSTMAIRAWGFEGNDAITPVPQSPFGGSAWTIPGIIQAENFDVPGIGRGDEYASYNDADPENHSCIDDGKESECTTYRDGTGVDIYKKSDNRLVVGYISKGEWMEYTVNVAKTGNYTIYAAVASDAGSSFKLSIDGMDISDAVIVPANRKDEDGPENYDDYNKVSTEASLTAGEHVLRITATDDWFEIDYFNFVEAKDAVDNNPIVSPIDPDEEPMAFSNVKLMENEFSVYYVFDIKGFKVGVVKFSGDASLALKTAGFSKGIYMLKQAHGQKTMMVNTVK